MILAELEPRMEPSTRTETEIRIGVSSCLLGQEVRFDGGHCRTPFVSEVLGEYVTFVPVCPEMEIGLGSPRETLRLRVEGDETRLVAPKSGDDLTERMRSYARERVAALQGEDLSGYVLKKDSPSCGLYRVRRYAKNVPSKDGVGVFAEELVRAMPLLPVEEEGRLMDAPLRESFIERVFAYRRLKDLFASAWGLGDLVAFHTAEKLLLFAHDEERYREMGRLVAGAKGMLREELEREYGELFMRAMALPATKRRNVNVLQHAMGHFKEELTPDERRELHGIIEDYRDENVPLIVPITMLSHHARRCEVTYLRGQTYFAPTPKELRLRNHVPALGKKGGRKKDG